VVSLTFSSGGQLVLTARQNYFNRTQLKEQLSSRGSNQMGKIVLKAGQFAQCLALNETPGVEVETL